MLQTSQIEKTIVTEIVGIAAVTAATTMGEVGNVSRFAIGNHFTTGSGEAPIKAPSGERVRPGSHGTGYDRRWRWSRLSESNR